jgi:TolB-like protein
LAAAVLGAVILLAALVTVFLSNRAPMVQPSKPTIALAPFTTASNDPELRQIAAEARDSLAHTFSQSGLPLQLVASASQSGELKANYVMSGDLSRTGDKVVAAVRVDDAAHAATVFSHKFEASGDDVSNLAERIGAQMAGNLTWAAPLMVLDPSHPLDPTLAAELLAGYDFGAGDPLTAYQDALRVASKAPGVRIAQITAAFDTSFVLDEIPRSERPEAVATARAAADRAMKLGADFGDTYATWCVLHSDALLAECESHLRTGRRVDPDAPFLNAFLSQLLRGVGRYGEAADLAGLSYSHDPYVPTKIGWMLLSAEYQRDDDGARTLYEKGVRWWPEFKIPFSNDRLRGVMERGDLDAIPALEKEIGKDGWAPPYRDSGVLELDWKSLPAVQNFCSQRRPMLIQVRCMLVLARFGDLNGAYAIANALYPRRLGSTAAETEKIWLDDPSGAGWTEFITSAAAAPLRRDQRYLILAQRTGLLDYWRTGTRPDFCQSKPEPICDSLLKRG